jgi:sugar phosphate isomerase/epimerase
MRTLNRRAFIEHSLAGPAIAAAVVGGIEKEARAVAPAVHPPEQLKICVMPYSFHGLLREGMIDVFGYLETAKYRYHLDAGDLWSGFLASTDEAYLQKVKAAFDERELKRANLAVDDAHVWDDDADIRAKNYANAKAHLNAARLLEVPFVRIDAGSRREDWTNEEFDHIVMRFKEYAQYSHDHGFTVGAENHWGPERTWSHYQKLYRAVDHPAFGLSCHIGSWAGTEEEVRQADRECAPWVSHTHIDFSICTGPLLEEKLMNLWKVGYAGYYSVEHHSAKDEYREVAIQLALVRNLLERFRETGG